MPNTVVLPSWVVDAVCEVPVGAHPSFAIGYSVRDNGFYREWDTVLDDRDDVHGVDRRARPSTADHGESGLGRQSGCPCMS